MLKKRKIWYAVSIVCLFLSIVCFLAGRSFHRQGNDFFRNVTLEAEGEPFEYQWIKSFFTEKLNKNNVEESAEEATSCTVWTELKNEPLFEDFSGRSCNADVIAVCGSSCNLIPFGKNLTKEDSSGCIIGKELAEKLFGHRQAEGKELLWNGQKWTVRGIVSAPSDLLIVEAFKMADQIPFDRISLSLEKGEDRQLKGENFISQYGISTHVLRFDYLGSLSWVSEIIPGKWSDFDGWKQNFKEHKKAEELAENAKRSAMESLGLEDWKRGKQLVYGAILFLIAAAFAAPDSLLAGFSHNV